jgi:cell fate (sporulation/competence/biofilm development) regulator YlbF (YheA/YmcA/DUF963 family)
MSSTEEILRQARDLGGLIAGHEASKKLEEAISQLHQDVDAERILNDYNRIVAKLAQKEMEGRPIEVEDKRQMDRLQRQVASHPLLRELQIAQMDYLDLMRRVDEAMTGKGDGGMEAGAYLAGMAGHLAELMREEGDRGSEGRR